MFVTRDAMPARDIVMVGDVPYIPVDDPWTGTGPKFPFPPPGPILKFVTQAPQVVWDDVSGAITAIWDQGTQDLKGIINFDFNTLHFFVEQALRAERIGWTSFVTYLQDWVARMSAEASDALHLLATTTQAIEISLYDFIANEVAMLEAKILADVVGIDVAVGQDILNVEHSIDQKITGVEAWAIDNIYSPLLQRVDQLGIRTLDGLVGVLDEAEAYARTLVNEETLKRIAALAGLASAVAAITTWIDDCGEPMCQQLGPKTDLGKLLKGLNLAADTLLLAELSTMTEAQLVGLINTLAAKIGTLVTDVETMFFQAGDTIGETISHEIAKSLF
jgi:hypothetical protein